MKRVDSTKRSLLVSRQNIHEIIGKALGREKEFNEYRYLFEEATKAKLITNYPIHLDFELNFICNIKCHFCILSLPKEKLLEWGDPEIKLSFKSFKKVIDEGVEKGLKSIGVHGNNEPLTVPDLPRYVAYARDKGVLDIFFNSNGLLLTPKKARELIDAGMTRMGISVDAFTAATYERYRIGGDYEKLRNNIFNLIEIKKRSGKVLPIIRLSYVVHENNIHELDDFINYWKGKVDLFAFQSLRDFFLYNGDISKKFRKLFKVDETKIDCFFVCPQPFQRMFVRNNGDVLPCCSAYGMKLVMGNIHHESIYDIWNGEKMREHRRILNNPNLQPEACRKCRTGSTQNFNIEELYAKLL